MDPKSWMESIMESLMEDNSRSIGLLGLGDNIDSDARRARPASIDSFQPELLARIMLLAGRMRPREMKDIGDQTLVLSHVSRYWHDVALSTPQLWASFATYRDRSPKKSQMFLERSKSALIDVDIDLFQLPQDRGWDEVIAHVLAQTSRFSELSFSTTESKLPECLYTRPAPFLKRLRISYRRMRWDDDLLTIPVELFDGKAPLLQSLALDGFAMDCKSPIFHKLTELNITSPMFRSPPHLRTTSVQMATILRCCASTLERLLLDDCLVQEATTPNSWATRPGAVTLPRLKMAKLVRFPFASVVHFLTSIVFSPIVHVNLLDVSLHDTDPMLTPIPILPERLFTTSYHFPDPSRCLLLDLNADRFQICMWDRVEREKDEPWYLYRPGEEDQCLDASFSFWIFMLGKNAFARNVLKDLPLSEIHTLKVGRGLMQMYSEENSSLDELFRDASQVRHLFLGSDLEEAHLESIIRLLSPPQSAHSDPGKPEELLLPYLVHLHFSATRIRYLPLNLVLDLIRGRARVGAQLKHLTIRKPSRTIPMLQVYAESIGANLVTDMNSGNEKEVQSADRELL
ncbi:hypothetical protein CONPUDRAFT_166082 [Coniophora puteana RWD-64-598 SS2]|uniref:Uncharacterized protein n=1 Tax=Coniophora puteana (strain RWD-64-598) TaxID=741705 RepID=A0A5M3MPF9_CONPW|nr:uncharacterized protein CONPUDRAFT_166082 [Coniophora puteana RWD-64-598 SS2]EIW80595.1 hypothetical protein CONPUDRAFT_166082 [Coniophora puteana RWD-64-598 SS2]